MATSPPTSRVRSRPPRVVAVRVSEAIARAASRPVACHAGASPNSRPTRSAAAAQNPSTRGLKERVTAAGSRPWGITDGATSRIAIPTAMPRAPPMTESTRLSVSSCRPMRRRPAPSAARTASSRARTLARAMSRLATFAQQMSSTKPTTPRKSSEVSRRSRPMSASCSGSTEAPRPLFVAGNSRARPSATADMSDCAAASVTPGFRCPTTSRKCAPRSCGRGSKVTSAQMLLRPTSWNDGGTTPTMV